MIPATIDPITKAPAFESHKRRTCAYARVSTNRDEQFTSYEAQVNYYTNYIKSREDLEFVKIYADEGITGTNTKKRDGFNAMIKDALDGKIELIITKSISRFARNTVDTLVAVRKLREKGVEVYFEKENIWSFDSKGEMMLTILSSLAQEESRSISENITWSKRNNAKAGKVSLAYSTFLGYDKSEDGNIVVNEEQAEIIRRIYREFMLGKTANMIAKGLIEDGIPTPTGKSKTWYANTIKSILKNEKYKGAAILQKTYTVDFLTKKIKKNEGELPQYYVEKNHEAIIPPEEWMAVQIEMKRRLERVNKYCCTSVYSSVLVCGDCGSTFGAKVWNSTNKYKKIVYQCNNKYKGTQKCKTPHLTEQQIKDAFVKAYNKLNENRTEIIENCWKVVSVLTDFTQIDKKLVKLNEEIEIVSELIHKCVTEHATTTQSQQDYLQKYNSLVERYENLSEAYNKQLEKKKEKQDRATALHEFAKRFEESGQYIQEFDLNLWVMSVEKVRVCKDNILKFQFKNGSEIEL